MRPPEQCKAQSSSLFSGNCVCSGHLRLVLSCSDHVLLMLDAGTVPRTSGVDCDPVPRRRHRGQPWSHCFTGQELRVLTCQGIGGGRLLTAPCSLRSPRAYSHASRTTDRLLATWMPHAWLCMCESQVGADRGHHLSDAASTLSTHRALMGSQCVLAAQQVDSAVLRQTCPSNPVACRQETCAPLGCGAAFVAACYSRGLLQCNSPRRLCWRRVSSWRSSARHASRPFVPRLHAPCSVSYAQASTL